MRTRFVSTVAALAVAVLALTGCTFITPIATQKPYDPSDGVGADIGDLALRNVLLVANNANEATLVMTVVNSSDEEIVLNLQYGDQTIRIGESITLPGGQTRTRVGDDPGTSIVISHQSIIPGALFPIYAEYGAVPGEVIQVPVLDGSLSEYDLYVP